MGRFTASLGRHGEHNCVGFLGPTREDVTLDFTFRMEEIRSSDMTQEMIRGDCVSAFVVCLRKSASSFSFSMSMS